MIAPASPIFTPQSLEFLSSFHAMPVPGRLRVPIVDSRGSSSLFHIRSEILTGDNSGAFREGVEQALAGAASQCPLAEKVVIPYTEGLWTLHRLNEDSVFLEGHHRQFVELHRPYVHMGYTTHSPVTLCVSMVAELAGLGDSFPRPTYSFRFTHENALARGLLDFLAPERPKSSHWKWSGEARDREGDTYRVQMERTRSTYDVNVRPVSGERFGLQPPLIDFWNQIERAVLDASGIVLQ